MFTIFSSLRPFTDERAARAQRNAVVSWTRALPQCEILLIGDEPGVPELAAELGIRRLPPVAANGFGKPYRGAVFEAACRHASFPLMCFVSGDIILTGDLAAAVDRLQRLTLPPFLLLGRRVDMDVPNLMSFEEADWEMLLRREAAAQGTLHGFSAVDWAIFPRDIPPAMYPPFSINYPGWDGWFICQFKMRSLPIIDATPSVLVVHQDHEDAVRGYRKNSIWKDNVHARGELARAGGFSDNLTMREADWLLTSAGLERPRLPRRALSVLASSATWRRTLGLKRWVQQRL